MRTEQQKIQNSSDVCLTFPVFQVRTFFRIHCTPATLFDSQWKVFAEYQNQCSRNRNIVFFISYIVLVAT